MRTMAPHSHHRGHHIENWVTTGLLLMMMAGLLALIGWIVLGVNGVLLTVAFGASFLYIGYQTPPEFIMRILGARRLTFQEAPHLFNIVRLLADRAGIAKMPELFYISSELRQSFTVGGAHGSSAIAITGGLIHGLSVREAAAVLAHEMSHVRNRDLAVMRIADLITGLTRSLSFAGLVLLLFQLPLYASGEHLFPLVGVILLIFAPLISALIQLAVSRTREFAADESAVEICGDPRGLASALEKIEADHGKLLWLRGWLPQRRPPEPSFLRTHPETAERVRRLLEMAPTTPPLPLEELVPGRVEDGHFVIRPTRWRRFWPWF